MCIVGNRRSASWTGNSQRGDCYFERSATDRTSELSGRFDDYYQERKYCRTNHHQLAARRWPPLETAPISPYDAFPPRLTHALVALRLMHEDSQA